MMGVRNFALFVALLLVTAGAAVGSADRPRASSVLKDAFAFIDPQAIETGILYDRVVPLSGIERFDGTESSPPANRRQWRQMVFEMSNASVQNPTWPSLDSVDETARRLAQGGSIPVAIMNFRYDKIRADAFEEGALAVRGDRVVQLGPRPFAEKRVFAVSALEDYTHRGERVAFTFDPRLYVSNGRDLPFDLEIDFDDGLGPRPVRLGEEPVVHYSRPGPKTVTAVARFGDGSELHASFPFGVGHLQTPNPDDTLSVTASIPYNGQFGTGVAYVYLSPGHSTITNPIVVVEGFDLDNSMNWDELYQLLNQENLLEMLRVDGFDAVVLNFTEATDYIQKNSFVVVALLEEIRSLLGPRHDIALVGGSMGGLCSRYALAYMETNGPGHGVREFISFDSPHRGANIPLGIQYWLDFFSDLSSEAAYLLSRLDTPAARQLLVYHHTSPPGTTGESDPLRAQMLSDLAAVGDYPTQPRKVAFADGSGSQADQGFLPGDQIIRYQYSSFFVGITGNAWAVPNATSHMIFDGAIRIIIPTAQLTVNVSGTLPYDNAPGGRRDSMAQMDATQAPYGDIVALYPSHCFVPTVSALDLQTNDLFYNVAGDPNILALTPFDAVYSPSQNEDHMTITSEMAGELISEVESGLTGVENVAQVPGLELSTPLPNPVSAGASIHFSTDGQGPVDIAVYDVEGRRVSTVLEMPNRAPGAGNTHVDVRDLPSGVYFVRLHSASGSVARKLVVLR